MWAGLYVHVFLFLTINTVCSFWWGQVCNYVFCGWILGMLFCPMQMSQQASWKCCSSSCTLDTWCSITAVCHSSSAQPGSCRLSRLSSSVSSTWQNLWWKQRQRCHKTWMRQRSVLEVIWSAKNTTPFLWPYDPCCTAKLRESRTGSRANDFPFQKKGLFHFTM